MTQFLLPDPQCGYIYVLQGQPDGAPWVAFVLPDGITPPLMLDALPADYVWPVGTNDETVVCGFWVFAPQAPANTAIFGTALRNSDAQTYYRNLTMPVWVADPDAVALDPFYIPTIQKTSPVVASNANTPLGPRFSFLIPSDSNYSYDPTAQGVSIAGQGGFKFNVDGTFITGFDQTLNIPLCGANAGQIVLNGKLAFDMGVNGANVGIHYAYQKNAAPLTKVGAEEAGSEDDDTSPYQQVPYPLFSLGGSSSKITYQVLLDPAAPFDHTRTRFNFVDLPTIESGFTDPSGNSLYLTPTSGAGLAFRLMYGGADSYLEPDGVFTLSATTSSDQDVTTPSTLLCGCVGTEYVSGPGNLTAEFTAGPAYCPFDPHAAAPGQALPLSDENGSAVTAWLSLRTGEGNAVYQSQPSESALFAAGTGLADYLFVASDLPVITAPSLPGLPVSSYGLFQSEVGTAPDMAMYQAFERSVLAPARSVVVQPHAKATFTAQRNRMLTGHAAAAASAQTFVTGRGQVIKSTGNSFTSIDLTNTVDNSGVTHQWQLTDISPTLQAAILSNQCFVVATRTADGSGVTLFNIEGGVAFGDWLMEARLSSDPLEILIIKFAAQSISDLANTLASWTDASSFNASPADVQVGLQSILAEIAEAASGSDADLAAYYQHLNAVVTEPGWNGVLALNPAVPSLPTAVGSLLLALKDNQLPGLALGIKINDISGGGSVDPAIAASAPFAVVDYEISAAMRGTSIGLGNATGFEVEYIRAAFENGTLQQFSASSLLELNQLFSLPVALQDDGADAAQNIIKITGSYQQPQTPGAPGQYTFSSGSIASFRIAYDYYDGQNTAQILDNVTLDNVKLVPVSATQSRFVLNGQMAFNPPAGTTGEPYLGLTADLFDFDALPFGNLGIIMTEDASHAGQPTFSFDVTKTVFDNVGNRQLRQGLSTDLPLTLNKMLPSGSISTLGGSAIQVPSSWSPPSDDFDYALVYDLDLGSPGAKSPDTSDFSANLFLGWSADGRYSIGLLVNGVGNSKTLTLNGVMQLTYGVVGINTHKNNNVDRLILLLQQCTVQFLGDTIPGDAKPFDIKLFSSTYPATRLRWFGQVFDAPPSSSTGQQVKELGHG
tara:strand:- start:4718 stop:8062 length:3345 start_codon:yes stop_codon:yes gene_type:complete